MGDAAAAATRRNLRGIAATPRPGRGYFAETSRRGCHADISRRRVAAAGTWIFRGGESPRPGRGYFTETSRRGRDVDISRRRVAVAGTWISRRDESPPRPGRRSKRRAPQVLVLASNDVRGLDPDVDVVVSLGRPRSCDEYRARAEWVAAAPRRIVQGVAAPPRRSGGS